MLRPSRITLAAIAGASLLFAAGCAQEASEADNAANDLMLEEANDASALESAINTGEPVPVANAADNAADDAGEADADGDEVESNVSGM
ncbi:MAG: hypothetical protein ACT4OE_05515 [Sphingosinicella sp.]